MTSVLNLSNIVTMKRNKIRYAYCMLCIATCSDFVLFRCLCYVRISVKLHKHLFRSKPRSFIFSCAVSLFGVHHVWLAVFALFQLSPTNTATRFSFNQSKHVYELWKQPKATFKLQECSQLKCFTKKSK